MSFPFARILGALVLLFTLSGCIEDQLSLIDEPLRVDSSKTDIKFLSAFDTVGFKPGWKCDAPIPHGRLVSTKNGYPTELIAQVPPHPNSKLDLYLFRVERAGGACQFYYVNYFLTDRPSEMSFYDTYLSTDPAFIKAITAVMGDDTKLCHFLDFETLSHERLVSKEIQDCLGKIGDRLGRAGIVIADSSDGDDQTLDRHGALIDGKVYWLKPRMPMDPDLTI